jgi:glycosyltransferase involved in cell wall biosynthesis
MFEENEISKNAVGGTELTKRGLGKIIDPTLASNFQIICSRVRELDPTKIRVYWVHDLPSDPECAKIKDKSFRDQFHLIAFTSDYLYMRFRQEHGVPYDEKFVVIESCIDPIDSPEKPDDTINLIYHTTPHRGLALLVPAFGFLAKIHPEIRLHVFSSFKVYGWPEADAQFEPLYEQIRQHEQATYHEFSGTDSYKDVVAQLEKTHIFGYPCVWEETFCRSVVEAMSAECLVVHPNFGALPFTSGGLNIQYPGDADHNKHLNTFTKFLDIAIKITKGKEVATKDRLRFNKAYVDTQYSTQYIANKWTAQMNALLQQYPDEASRALPKPDDRPMFVFNTSPR